MEKLKTILFIFRIQNREFGAGHRAAKDIHKPEESYENRTK
jgi:hypothetical protein